VIDTGLRKNVRAECRRRGDCRSGLGGVPVRRLDTGEVREVRFSTWNKDSRLILTLDDGAKVPAGGCELEGEWPVVCCPPRRLTA
jgi:hypothetical protein